MNFDSETLKQKRDMFRLSRLLLANAVSAANKQGPTSDVTPTGSSLFYRTRTTDDKTFPTGSGAHLEARWSCISTPTHVFMERHLVNFTFSPENSSAMEVYLQVAARLMLRGTIHTRKAVLSSYYISKNIHGTQSLHRWLSSGLRSRAAW
jgi:hypothetical protein